MSKFRRVLLGGMLSFACSDDGTSAAADTDMGSTSAATADAGSSAGGPSTSQGTADSDPSAGSTTMDTGDATTGDPGPTPASGCDPFPPPQGETIMVSPSDNLEEVVANAPGGSTLLLQDGTYDVSGNSFIGFRNDGVTLRSASGDADAVVLDGGYAIGSILNVVADDITIAEVTLQRCMWHPIHVTGGDDSNTERTTIYGVKIFDPGQQAIKINSSEAGFYADDGEVACSSIVMTDAGRSNVTDCYTGGIDAHLARGWVVRDNYVEGFWCEQGLSEHAVHFWNSGRDTLVERNVIVDCARGIGFGLGAGGNGTSRDYGDDPCPGADFVGHYDGIIRNNTVWGNRPEMFASQSGFDSGIALEQACGTTVVHNTIVALQQPFVSIEYRFPNTDVTLYNNLVTHAIMERDGGVADLQGNMTDAGTAHFVDPATGDLHLVSTSTAIDAGVDVGGSADEDMDGEPRDANPDVGADEYAG